MSPKRGVAIGAVAAIAVVLSTLALDDVVPVLAEGLVDAGIVLGLILWIDHVGRRSDRRTRAYIDQRFTQSEAHAEQWTDRYLHDAVARTDRRPQHTA